MVTFTITVEGTMTERYAADIMGDLEEVIGKKNLSLYESTIDMEDENV